MTPDFSAPLGLSMDRWKRYQKQLTPQQELLNDTWITCNAQGLSVLCRLLRDDGVMRLALYSEHARQSVAACRRHISQRGCRSTPVDIRRRRAELMLLERGDPRREAMKLNDFYSMSEGRDLLAWDAHERQNPDLFARMYVFWVRKSAAGISS